MYATGWQKLSLTAQELKSDYSLTLKLHSSTIQAYMAIDGQVCFHRWLFTNPSAVKPWRCTGFLELVKSINEDVCGAKLLPSWLSHLPCGLSLFLSLIKDTALLLCPKGRTASSYPLSIALPPPTSLWPLIVVTHDIAVTVKEVAQNPALCIVS